MVCFYPLCNVDIYVKSASVKGGGQLRKNHFNSIECNHYSFTEVEAKDTTSPVATSIKEYFNNKKIN